MGLGLGRALPVVAGVKLNQAGRNLRKGLPPCRTGRCFMRGNGKPPNGFVAAPLRSDEIKREGKSCGKTQRAAAS
jgi:hypothetical protein